jgi:proline iminopeptidase
MRTIRQTTICFLIFIFIFGEIADVQSQDDSANPVSGSPNMFVDVEGTRLNYVIEGKGKTCLVIGSSVYYPRTFSENLKNNFRFVFVDTRHYVQHDESYKIDSITLDTYISDIELTRKALGMEKFIIIGHSVHSLLALEYARNYPHYVSHIVMIGAFPYGGPKRANASDKFWEDDASKERKALLEKNMVRLTEDANLNMSPGEGFINEYILSAPMYWYDPGYDCAWLWQGVELNMDVLSRLFGGIISQYEVGNNREQITTPVFLALGRYDYIAPYYLWNEFKDQFANLSFNLFENSGHTPQLEEQNQFDTKLIEWIDPN